MPEVDLLYINLDRAVERRTAIEANLNKINFSDAWRWQRFPAILGSSEEVTRSKGKASPSLKGNWLSHIGCMRLAIESGWTSHLLISEDDTEFSVETERIVDLAITNLATNDWDILYLDFLIPRAIDMPYFFSLKQNCVMKDTSVMFKLDTYKERFAFAGAGAYIINKASLRRVFEEFASYYFDVAFDVALRWAVINNTLQAFAVFPFPATVNLYGDKPDVNHSDDWVYECSLMHEFRRMIWADSSLSLKKEEVKRGELTPDVEKFQSIFSKLLSRQYGLI